MKVEIANEHLDELVKEALIETYTDCLSLPVHDSPDENIEFLHCLKKVIEHYSTPRDYAEWAKSVESYD